ncbi:hypothetical protein BRADI_1g05230v3 [Brachypodium distachyon]|uniref:BRCT domain-containing protein n=1 Tax=Brachypodium distachyon TaxID=15368 RepID=A0A0Q3RHE2_BRADI|nr:hypothetical protein BRADI_1g05230v3 [Brachypodium distachyon]
MGEIKRNRGTRRTPRSGGGGRDGGGRSGGLPAGDGGAGRGGLPADDGGGGMGGLPGDTKVHVTEPSGMPAPRGDTCRIGGTLGGSGGGGLHRRGKGHAEEASGRPARVGESEDEIGGTPRGYGEAGSGGILAGSGGGTSRLHGGGKRGAVKFEAERADGPFSGILMLCVDFTSSKLADEVFEAYKEKIEELGGTYVTGYNYKQATHLAVMGNIPPGARTFWEGESKQVTKIKWIDDCYREKKLLPIEAKGRCENLISQPNEMTPVSRKSSASKCLSTSSKKLKHATRNKSGTPRRLDFSSQRSIYHRHLSCEAECEFTEQLYDYALRYRMSEYCEIPGCDQTIFCEEDNVEIIMPQSMKTSKLGTKVVVLRSFARLVSMHQEGWALGGNFSGKNIRIYADESVKFHGLADGVIVRYNDEDGDLDYTQFVYVIKEEVFLGQTLPFDLTEWLRIISQGVKSCHRNLLCNHIDLMEPYQAYGHFVCMYQIFWNIEGTPGWTDLLGSLGHYSGWRSQGVKCSFIASTLNYVAEKNSTLEFDDESRIVDYEDDVRGLLRVVNNTFKHKAISKICGLHHNE